MTADLNGKRVLVTGGTGFIGGRLVERIHRDHDAKVRILTRDLSHAPRIARFPVEIVGGDVLEKSDINRAIDGCDIVFHCAYGNRGSRGMRWKTTVEGTRNVAQAALRANVETLVHVSTWAVYGHSPDGDLDERAPRRHSNYDYADSKLRAEQIVARHANEFGLPAVIIQPTTVYGPHSLWVVQILEQLKSGRLILVNGGDGLCNAVYIDDVINAMLLAVSSDRAIGETFLISGEAPVTWRRFYAEFEAMLGVSRNVSMSSAEARAYARKAQEKQSFSRQLVGILRDQPQLIGRLLSSREISALLTLAPPAITGMSRRIVTQLIQRGGADHPSSNSPGELPMYPLDPWSIRRLASKIRVRIDKANRLLGYQPAFAFETGIRLTEQWARWANLLERS